MSDTVRVVHLTARVAPDGTWSSGDVREVHVSVARALVRNGLARLAEGESLPVDEIAAVSGGDVPSGERRNDVAARKPGGVMRLG